MLPRVSVIIAAYNAREFVEMAVASALEQTEKRIEVLVVDDGSIDGTAEVVRRFEDPRIRLFALDRNGGQSHARNVAIKEAKGEWITFLDADDWYAPNRLETMLRAAEEHGTDIVADDVYRLFGPEDPAPRRKLEKRRMTRPEVIDAAGFLRLDSGLKPVIRRQCLTRNGILFDESLRYGEDTLLLLECLLAGARLILIPEALYYYRDREGSLTTFRVETLIQRSRTTQELLRRDNVQRDPTLRRLLEERLAQADEGVRYYKVMEPLRSGRWGEALNAGLFSASFVLLFLKAVPKVLNNRIWRRLSLHT